MLGGCSPRSLHQVGDRWDATSMGCLVPGPRQHGTHCRTGQTGRKWWLTIVAQAIQDAVDGRDLPAVINHSEKSVAGRC